jgi:hypothetical protein
LRTIAAACFQQHYTLFFNDCRKKEIKAMKMPDARSSSSSITSPALLCFSDECVLSQQYYPLEVSFRPKQLTAATVLAILKNTKLVTLKKLSVLCCCFFFTRSNDSLPALEADFVF